jgi:predicted nucleic acid-binding protein
VRVYCDTSVFGGFHDEEFAAPTQRFFEEVKRGRYVILVSPVTLDELSRAPTKTQRVLESVPDEYVEELDLTAEVTRLAQMYVAAGVLGKASRGDAAHVAAASVAGADLILSWNFRHIVNYERIQKFNAVNLMDGYRPLDIRSPQEIGYGLEDDAEDV